MLILLQLGFLLFVAMILQDKNKYSKFFSVVASKFVCWLTAYKYKIWLPTYVKMLH